MKNILGKNWTEMIINIIKWIGLVYIIVFAPSIILGIKVGATITFFAVVIWGLYKTNEEYHQERERYLKDLLKNDGWKEETINYGLEKIEEERSNK